MMGTKNPNHRNYYAKPVKKEVIVEAPIVEDEMEEVLLEEDTVTIEYIYALNKKEQVDLLKEIGYSNKDIKQLKKEKDRVDEIFKHVGMI